MYGWMDRWAVVVGLIGLRERRRRKREGEKREQVDIALFCSLASAHAYRRRLWLTNRMKAAHSQTLSIK